MTATEKNTKWMIWLVVILVVVGIGIQVALGAVRNARRLYEGQMTLEAAAAAVDDTTLDREERLQLDTASLKGLPAEKKAAYEDLHLEFLTVVNPWNPLPENYTVELEPIVEWQIGEDQSIDVRCADQLLKMIHDCQAAGNRPYICSSYRTQDKQAALYYNKLGRVLEWGYSYEEALNIAAQAVALPGTSEHQLGLAADIIDEEYTELDEWQEQTSTQEWLMENCWRYGFILRYPNGTTDITGIIYEPWHYRYVGERFAKDITERGITLEEYAALRRGR